MTRNELQQILAEFPRVRVLVAGDFCLDRWCRHDPALAVPSRETGIARVAVRSYEVTAGAGGTVCNNLAALGAASVEIVAVAGDDANGFELRRVLERRGISTSGLICDPERQTFTYTKLINAHTGIEDLPRLDFVNVSAPSEAAESEMLRAMHHALPAADVVLVADQSEIAPGAVITERVRSALIAAAERFPAKLFVADSRSQVEKFHGLIVKPNEDEALAAAARIAGQAPSPSRATAPVPVEEAGDLLRQHLGGRAPLYITRGGDGVLLFGGPQPGEAPQLILARRNPHPVDICGAGDAFEAGLALTLAATARLYGASDYVAAAHVGHLAAAVTITKPGTGTATPVEILAMFDQDAARAARA